MFRPLRHRHLPPILRFASAIVDDLKGKLRGLDLEWDKYENPTILGLSDDKKAVSVPYSDGRSHLVELAKNKEITFIGHSLISADLPALERDNIHIPLEQIEDTILRFYLTNMHLCVARDTFVWMSNGSWKKICKIELGEKVKTVVNGEIVSRSVIGITYTHNRDCWMKVVVDGKHKNGPVYVTEDHKWFTDRGEVQTKELLARKDRVFLPQAGSSEFLEGTILGDAYVSPDGQFMVTHTNRRWAKAKAEHLALPLKERIVRGFGLVTKGWYVQCNIPKSFRKKFYNQAGIKRWVSPVSSAALAVLYGDDGSLHKTDKPYKGKRYSPSYGASFSVHCFLPKYQKEILDFFQKRYGEGLRCNGKCVFLHSKESKRFFEDIAPWLHPSMAYKLPPQFRRKYNGWMAKQKPLLGEVLSTTKTRLPKRMKHSKEMCLMVKEGEAFFTRCGLVSNCKMSGKSVLDDDEDERKGRGFMNLGTMLSLYTDLPHYKSCKEVTHIDYETEETGALYKTGKRKGETKTRRKKVICTDVKCTGACPVHRPFEYNALDSIGPVLALPGLLYHSKLRGVDHLYPLHRDLAAVLVKIRERGVPINEEYVENELRSIWKWRRDKIKENLPFSPTSGKQIMDWCKAAGINISNTQESTIRELTEDPTCPDEIHQLLEYKEEGNGPDRWFGEKYVKDGWAHPRLGIFTSSGRFNCSGPNYQNIAKRRVDRKTGENIDNKFRKAIEAPEGYYLYASDYNSAENRVFLYLAGYPTLDRTIDFHTWMAENLSIKKKDPFALSLGSPRDAAKSVTHATDYLEGLSLLVPESLRSTKIRREIELGARIVFPKWTFEGRVVTFTGINLAKRAFGSASWENRKKALDAQQRYFAEFPKIRDLQKRITDQCQNELAVRPPHGYYTLSYGHMEDRLKTAAAIWGSQVVAHYTKLALLRLESDGRILPILQVHDEIVGLADARHEPSTVKGWIQEGMEFDTNETPGLVIPTKVKVGRNWAEMKEVE